MTHSDPRYDARPAANRYRAGSYIIIIIGLNSENYCKDHCSGGEIMTVPVPVP